MMDHTFEKIQAYFRAHGNQPASSGEIARAVDLEKATVAAVLYRTHRRSFVVAKPKTSEFKVWCLVDPSGEGVADSGTISCELPGHLLASVRTVADALKVTPEEVMVEAVTHGLALVVAQTLPSLEQDPGALARINTHLPGDGRNDAELKQEDKCQ